MRKIGIIAVLSLMALAIAAVPAIAARPHPPASAQPIECHLNPDNTVTCTGDLAGLGNVENIDVFVDADFACATRGNAKQPPGHLQGEQRDIPVRSGRASFSVTTGPASCPAGLNPVVGQNATITVTNSATGEVLFTQQVP